MVQQQKIERDTYVVDAGSGSPEQPMVIDGRYVLKREIAVGGGSRVYAAEHRFLKRTVAVKLAGTEFSQPAVLFARLRREAELLAMLKHEGIVQVLDAGMVGEAPYLVMELLEGRTLAGLLTSRGRLGPAEVVRIGSQIARALEACHAAGIVHRDIKPSNLFVTMNPDVPVKVLDFGIAKLAAERAPTQEKLTQMDAILGTPEYMAPESLLSSPTADHRVDVYGLAVTLYECLTGAVPFDGRYGEVLLKISTSPTPSVIDRRPDTPPALASAIVRGLARDPADRYATVQQFREALEAVGASVGGDMNLLQHGFGGRRAAAQPQRPPPPPRPQIQSGVIPQHGTPGQAPPPLPPQMVAPQAPPAEVEPVVRRRFARAPYITPCRIVRPGGEVIDGRVEEVSEGGILFVGTGPCEPGETIKTRFALPASGKIAQVTAAARWTRAARGAHATGFEFVDLADDTRAAIAQYVAIMCPNG